MSHVRWRSKRVRFERDFAPSLMLSSLINESEWNAISWEQSHLLLSDVLCSPCFPLLLRFMQRKLNFSFNVSDYLTLNWLRENVNSSKELLWSIRNDFSESSTPTQLVSLSNSQTNRFRRGRKRAESRWLNKYLRVDCMNFLRGLKIFTTSQRFPIILFVDLPLLFLRLI